MNSNVPSRLLWSSRKPAEFDSEGHLVTHVGSYRLVHMDAPDAETVEKRNRMVEEGSFFDDDCPICQAQKRVGGGIVFEADLDGSTEIGGGI